MNQTLKGIRDVATLEMRYFIMLQKFGRKVPIPRSPFLRSVLGLSAEASPGDGEKVRALLADETK